MKEQQLREYALLQFESQIIRGFIIVEVVVLGMRVVFKTLMPHERTFLSDYFSEEVLEDAIFALSVYSIGGRPVYRPRLSYEYTLKVMGMLNKASDVLRKRAVLELNRAVNISEGVVDLFFDYMVSTQARVLWKSLKAAGGSRGNLIADRGVDRIPLSGEFIGWAKYHAEEDGREHHQILWGMVRTVVAASNHKMAKSLPDDLYAETANRSLTPVENRYTKSINTNQDLVDQMVDFVEGREDEHDRIFREIEEGWARDYEEDQAKQKTEMEKRKRESRGAMITSNYRVLE